MALEIGRKPKTRGPVKLMSRAYPIAGLTSTHTPVEVPVELKPYMTSGFLKNLWLRVVGNITRGGNTSGLATGRENHEAIIRNINVRTTPDFGAVLRKNITPRVAISQQIFDQGFAIRATDITDNATTTVAVDFKIPIIQHGDRRRYASEFYIPMAALSSFVVRVECAGRDQLFSGGAYTWELGALQLEFWAEIAEDVALPAFHLSEEFEETIPIVSSRRDLKFEFDSGWIYESILLLAERDNVVDDTLINDIAVESGSLSWLPIGGLNAPMVRYRNSLEVLPSETLTGLYFLNLMPEGMATRGANALDQKLVLTADVTLGSGTDRRMTARVRRFRPHYLQAA